MSNKKHHIPHTVHIQKIDQEKNFILGTSTIFVEYFDYFVSNIIN